MRYESHWSSIIPMQFYFAFNLLVTHVKRCVLVKRVGLHPCQEENAKKAKLRRLCQRKADGSLKVPEWLHDAWKNGDHLEMANQLHACNYDKVTGLALKKKIHSGTNGSQKTL